MIKSLSFLLFCLWLASPGFSQEWTRFRGPNGSGVGEISSLPAEFSSAEYSWAIKLNGQGHSSPVLWGEKLFITLADENTDERRLLCVDSKSGKVLWRWNAPHDEHNLHNFNNFASATPTTDGQHVYVVWGSGKKTEAVAIDHSGKEVWKKEWPDFTSDHGHASSPVMIGGKLVFHTDSLDQGKSYVFCLEPTTGETIWKYERTTPIPDEKHITAYNTPVSVKVGDREMVVALQTNDGWRGLDIRDGSVGWSYDGGYKMRSVGSMVESEGILFATFGSGGNGKNSTALLPDSGSEPKVLYSLGIKDGLGYVPTPLIYNGMLFLLSDGGILTCRNAKTGEIVGESQRIGGNYFSSPVIGDGKIICASRDGELVTISTEKPFKVLGRSRLESGVNATPAIANNRLFVKTDTHLFAVKGK